MSQWTIYFNPKCGSCRKALDLLRSRRIEPRIVEYLKTPPTAAEVEGLLGMLGGDPMVAVRTKEEEFAESGLDESSGRGDVAAAIARYPILLQRPIVINGKRAVVARPPERVEALF